MLSDASEILDLPDGVDAGTLRVYAPTQVIFLCGGPTQAINGPAPPESLRDAFQRIRHHKDINKYQIRLAEEVLPFFPNADYRDLLNFESDIAQICEIILLFSESYGSLCELGAFAMDREISRKLLTVISRHHYDQQSFVRLGPIQMLINEFGQGSIFVLNDSYLGIRPPNRVQDLDTDKFRSNMISAISGRTARSPKSNAAYAEHSSFNKLRPGHIIKLITGIIQHYGSMTACEIDLILRFFDISVSPTDMNNYLMCARFVDWIRCDPTGGRVLYSARPGKNAISYELKSSFSLRNKQRWQTDVREYWKTHDPERFHFISEAVR